MSCDGGLAGVHGLESLPVCTPACRAESKQFAGRYLANLRPALAGHAVAALGLAAGLVFRASGRDLGGLLVAFSIFGFGTTRLAYPEVVPMRLVHRFGSRRAIEAFQWLGIAACLSALAVALVLIFA